MSQTHLPDDPRDWPNDPFELLGVSYADDAKKAKRAYLRLVKQYKPEHSPAEFQIIREAFEIVTARIEFRNLYSFHVEETTETHDSIEPRQGDDDAFPIPRSDFDDSSDSPNSICESAWRMAIEGKEADAYAKLVSARERFGDQTEIIIRLYWLLKSAPHLDHQRQPCDWLTVGLAHTKLSGPLRELYRREMFQYAEEAVTGRCTRLIECDAHPGLLTELLEWRWENAVKLRRVSIIPEDLAKTRERIAFDDEAAWARLLIAALEHLTWFSQPEFVGAARHCHAALEQLGHLQMPMADAFDRLDLLDEIARDWRAATHVPGVPTAWLQIIPLTWTRSPADLRPAFSPLLREMAESPIQTMDVFDRLADYSIPILSQLGAFIQNFRYEVAGYQECERPAHESKIAANRFVQRFARGRYDQYDRRALLRYCVREAIDPRWICEASDEQMQRLFQEFVSWSETIEEDGPLLYAYAAHRAFWG